MLNVDGIMTALTYTNGQLIVKNNALGVNSGCCCENPPPWPCYDCLGDACAYFIEVTSPSSLKVKSPAVICGELNVPAVASVPYMLLDAFPEGTQPNSGDGQININRSHAQALNVDMVYLTALNANVQHYLTGRGIPIPPSGPLVCSEHFLDLYFAADAFISSTVRCQVGHAPYPFSVVIMAHVSVHLLDADADVGYMFCRGSWYWDAEAEFPLTSECQTISGLCGPTPSKYHVIETPVTFTADGTTTSLGGYTANNTTSDGDYASTAQAIGENLRDALTATFRITSRPSCHEVPADCEVPIGEGNTLVVWDREEFVLGTFSFSSYTGPGNTSEEFDHSEGDSGTAAYPYLFAFHRRNAEGITLDSQLIELFCDVDDTVSPPVSRWYVHQTVYCYEDGAGGPYSIDEWIGTIPTYESGGCHNIAAGDPVPIGTADLEHVPGYPVNFLGATCVPPAPMPLELKAPCGGS